METEPDQRSRWLAAASHLGFPFYTVLLPVVIWVTSQPRSFVRSHARQALSFQCLFLVAWIISLMFVVFRNDMRPLVLCALTALVVESVQIIRALRGRQPIQMLPAILGP